MKVLIISNVPGSVDLLVEILENNHNVVAKETNVSTYALAEAAGEQIRKGIFGNAIVVAKDPIGVCMALNKQDGVNAAVCNSSEDVELAKSNGANVIALRDINSSELPEMVSLIAGGGLAQNIKLNIKLPRILPKKAAMEEKFTKERQPQARTAEREMPQKEEKQDEPRPSSGKQDVVSRIKDYLGIL